MSERRKLVVVGNGMAGARLVEELVARGGRDAWDIVVFGEEPYGNYNRILLSSVLAGSHDPRDIFLNPIRWYEENGVTLHAGLRVRGIDRRARVVHAGNGVMERYDALVLATGSVPFVPPLERLRLDDGSFREGAFVFRTLDDTEAMIQYAARSKKAAVIGGGLLGLEAARGLLALGVDVHVVHLMKHLMEVQLDAPAGRMLEKLMKVMGMHVHLGRATCGVIGEERVQGLLFADGLTLDCDMLVISAGIRPNTQLAIDAGLEVERGIVVGDDLATSDTHVYAIGECAQHRGMTYGLVAPLWEQARVLAERLSARTPGATYVGSRISTKLKVAGVELAVMGEREATSPDDEEVTYSEPARGVYKKLVVRGGKLAGAILLGDASSAPLCSRHSIATGRCPTTGPSSCSPSPSEAPLQAPSSFRTTRRFATATGSPRAPSSRRCGADAVPSRPSATARARRPGAARASARSRRSSRRLRATPWPRIRACTTTCPAYRSPSRSSCAPCASAA